jgi:hypothetical protein
VNGISKLLSDSRKASWSVQVGHYPAFGAGFRHVTPRRHRSPETGVTAARRCDLTFGQCFGLRPLRDIQAPRELAQHSSSVPRCDTNLLKPSRFDVRSVGRSEVPFSTLHWCTAM